MAWGLTIDGFEIPRAADVRTAIFDALDARLAQRGLPAVDRTAPDSLLGMIVDIVGDREAAVWEVAQAVYNGRSLNNAEGVNLADALRLVGVPSLAPTYSTVLGTLTGDANLLVPALAVAENPTTGERWILTGDALLDGAGNGTGNFRAESPGETVALTSTITKIVSGVSGWDTITNTVPATVGRGRESAAEQRARRGATLALEGTGTAQAIVAELAALSFVAAVAVLVNQTLTPLVVDGVTMQPASIAIYTLPSTITVPQQEEIAAAIFGAMPSATGFTVDGGADVSAVVDYADVSSILIEWKWGAVLSSAHVTTVVPEPGFALSDLITPVEAIVAEHYASLNMGDPLRSFSLHGALRDVPGLQSASYTFDTGSGPSAADVVPQPYQHVVLGSQSTVL